MLQLLRSNDISFLQQQLSECARKKYKFMLGGSVDQITLPTHHVICS